ncbi:MAG TPA: hypothetical protein VFU55_11570 [Terracidiphilus sp.]|nr:hypothetical protein [Terracidiphilus sp.]
MENDRLRGLADDAEVAGIPREHFERKLADKLACTGCRADGRGGGKGREGEQNQCGAEQTLYGEKV